MQADLSLPLDALWKPTSYTPTEAEHSKGAAVKAFAEIFLQAIDGAKAGEKIILTQWQNWLISNILQTDENMLFKFRRALVLLPRKNGKTFLIAITMLFLLVVAPDYSQMFSGAKDRNQALNVFNMVAAWIRYSPELSELLKITESKSMITNRQTGSTYRALAADGDASHGTNPYFVIIDEVHAMLSKKHREFVTSLTSGMGALKESLVVFISTAGGNVHIGLLGELYKYGKKLAAGELVDEAFGFYCWEAEEGDDYLSHDTWRKANPQLAEGFLDLEVMIADFKTSAEININDFLRFRLNVWISVAGDPFIQPNLWTNIYDENACIEDRADIVVGFDGSKNGDSTCITIMDLESGALKIWKIWERPHDAGPDYFINRQDVENSFIALHNKYNVKLIWADKFYYENDLLSWAAASGHNWNVSIIPQGDRMKTYAKDFQKDVAEKNISHFGEEVLTRHLSNTYADEEKVFVKEAIRTTNRIDATVASILANGARNWILNEEPEEELEWYSFNG